MVVDNDTPDSVYDINDYNDDDDYDSDANNDDK